MINYYRCKIFKYFLSFSGCSSRPCCWMQVMTHSASSAVTVNGGLHVMFNTVLQYWLTLLFCSACIDWCEGVAGLLSLTGLQISCLAFIQEATCSCQKEPTVFNFTAHSWIISVTQRLCLTHNCKLITCKPCETWMVLSLEQAQMFLDLLAMFKNYWIWSSGYAILLMLQRSQFFNNVTTRVHVHLLYFLMHLRNNPAVE